MSPKLVAQPNFYSDYRQTVDTLAYTYTILRAIFKKYNLNFNPCFQKTEIGPHISLDNQTTSNFMIKYMSFLSNNILSTATLLDTCVHSHAIQYNSFAINSTFYKVYNVQFLLTLPEMCKFNYMF